MARIKTLDALKKDSEEIGEELTLGTLPNRIKIYDSAMEKGYRISQLVRKNFGKSYEWYGFLIGRKDSPETIVDLGIGKHECNQDDYVSIAPEKISEVLSALPEGFMINGWMHSHGDLDYKKFSSTDYQNMRTILGFVSPATERPLLKKEAKVKDLSLLLEGKYAPQELISGNITAVTSVPIDKIRLLEKIYGSFSYSIVIGDSGWHKECISYETRGFLTHPERKTVACELEVLPTGLRMDEYAVKNLEEEIMAKITPPPKEEEESLEVDLKSLAAYLRKIGLNTVSDIENLLKLGEK